MPLPPLHRALGLLLLVLLARCGGPPEIDCTLTKIAQMPLQVQDQLLVVPAGINGKWVRLVADTGAERTTISDAAADRLGLPHDPRYINRSLGIGGATTTTDVTVERLVLGGVRFPVERIAVGTFKLRTDRGLDADGLLGADILLAFDMDIDVPGGKLTLYRSRVCPNIRPPWQEPAVEIIGVKARKDRLLLPFDLDGVSGMAILDTGAQRNVLGVDMARRMGLNEPAMAGDPTTRQRGVGPAVTVAHLHRFNLLRIGPVAVESPSLTVLPSDFGVGDALLGEEFLQGRRVWLSFRNRQVFVSRRADEQ
ncbi:MAG: retropepsin-like aspartic protease [Rhodopila sp.]|nr:retropepsin-like aspartic protease [Rhodopila sp.]